MSKKNWKATIWHGRDLEAVAEVFGESIEDLRQSASSWLAESEPNDFSSVSSLSEYSERSEYGYSDGTRVPNSLMGGSEPLPEGWYYFPPGVFGKPELLDSYGDAVAHFIERSIRPSTGPDYKHIPLVVDSETRYHLIKRVRRISETPSVNDHLQRGWTIIGIEYEGGPAPKGEGLAYRKATFILAHADQTAI